MRYNCTTVLGGTGFGGRVVLVAAVPTSKTGAFDGFAVELLSLVMSSLLNAPVSLLAARMGVGGVAAGVVLIVIVFDLSETLAAVRIRLRAVPAGKSSVTTVLRGDTTPVK